MSKNIASKAAYLLCAGSMFCSVAVAAEVAPLPAYTVQNAGFENAYSPLDAQKVGVYHAGMSDADGGVLEIVDYCKANGHAYAVNGKSGQLVVIAMADLRNGVGVTELSGTNVDVKALVEDATFVYGDMTSVAVSPDGKTLAVAIQSEDYAANGRVALFDCHADGSVSFRQTFVTGVQPDMVTFTPDGRKILTANEGEPRKGYGAGAIDPAGSVTIVDLAKGSTAVTVGFTAFDSAEARQAMVNKQIVLKKGAAPSVDLEPEYIACNNDTAYISLQEANAIAVLDLHSNSFKGIHSVGFEDYSKVAVDIDKKDGKYRGKTYASLRGVRMPDAIALTNIGGQDYLLTANEGDSRDWDGYCNEDARNFGKGQTSPSGKITAANGLSGKVTFLNAKDHDGLDSNLDYLYGSRSFSCFRINDNGLEEVFDSSNDFESKTALYLPKYFNCSNDDVTIDDRSGKKGPEPETVVTGRVNGKDVAFVTLERIGGVMMYELLPGGKARFANYINTRDFNQHIGDDDSPEGLKFIPAADSPTGKALLLAACEVGGTVAAYEITYNGK